MPTASRSLPGALLVMFAVTTWARPGESVSVEVAEAIGGLARATDALHSFDVVVRRERVYLKAIVAVGGTPPDKRKRRVMPAFEIRELKPGEAPKILTEVTRQVLSPDGRRRFELLPTSSDTWIDAKVFTGEVVRDLNRRNMTGNILASVPDQFPFVPYEDSYFASYLDLFLGGELLHLLRMRSGVRIDAEASRSSGMVVLESPPEEGDWYPLFGWRIWLDPDRGMMPQRIDVFRESMEHRYNSTTIEEFREIEPGVWAPVKITRRFGPEGEETYVSHLTVDVEKSSWNQPTEDEVFELIYPPGTTVNDTIRQIAFVAGEGDTGSNLDGLIAGARRTLRYGAPRPDEIVPVETQSNRWLFILVAVHVLAVAGILVLYTRMRRRRLTNKPSSR